MPRTIGMRASLAGAGAQGAAMLRTQRLSLRQLEEGDAGSIRERAADRMAGRLSPGEGEQGHGMVDRGIADTTARGPDLRA